ncbi:hypothetical protein DITRI_Ditri13aG0066300 [Diplodiscus trichospermus]
MGSCFSKKKASSSHHNPQPQATALPVSSAPPPFAAETNLNSNTLKAVREPKVYKVTEEEQVGNAVQEEDSLVKKEIFVIKHRKSHERHRRSPPPQNAPHSAPEESASSASTKEEICNINTAVRTSSCTKEEVDAILIQCGRLSRSNSSGKTPSSSRKYSGSKRSYDYDNEKDNDTGVASSDYGLRKKGNEDLGEDDRPRHRQSSRSSSSQGRRRTPSREREQRSGSRERGCSGNGGRRVSRSPGRRSENTQGTFGLGSNAANAANRPGKMVSVPATVSSMETDKSNGGVEAATTTTVNAIKRISVKRNVGVGEAAVGVGSRTAASPRSQSPARTNPNAKGCNENQPQPTLSRSSSRKAEQSPHRRNPLSEIDPNTLAFPQSATNKGSCCISKGQGGIKESTNVINQNTNVEMNHKVIVQGTNHKAGSTTTTTTYVDNRVNSTAKEQRMIEEVKTQPPKAGAENLKPQPLTRSRSSRRSRELDLNPETLLNPIPSSYTTLLLEDIQNFHQTNNVPSFSLPPCVSKACSILEAVADLNSTTSSNLSGAFSEDRKGLSTDESNKNGYNIGAGKKITESRDPVVESEVMGSDDLMEPSFHKYVTLGRGGGTDMEEQESSGSNSFVGSGGQLWAFSSSSWEPNSADSTDRWTSTTKSREEDYSGPLGPHRHALPESGSDTKTSNRKGLSGRRRESDHQYADAKIRGGLAGKGLHSIPFAAAAST